MFTQITDIIKSHRVLFTLITLFTLGFLAVNAYVLNVFYKAQDEAIMKSYDQAYETILNLRIKSVSKDKLNYYVSYTYETKGKGEYDENIFHEELLTLKLSDVGEQDFGVYVARELKTVFVNSNKDVSAIDELKIKDQVEYVIAHPDEQINDGTYVPSASVPGENGTPPPTNGNNGETFQPEVTGVPPVVPPVLYDTSGPPPIDYYPAPGDPPPPN